MVKDGLRNVASHHIDSFNYALGTCLPKICRNMLPVEISAAVYQEKLQQTSQDKTKQGQESSQMVQEFPFKKYTMWFEEFELRKPVKHQVGGLGGS